MRRIYFLVPNIATTKKIVDDLLLAKIEEKHVHVIAKRGTPLEDLPEANLLQKSDFIPAVEQGIALGGATGLLAGLVAIALPPGLYRDSRRRAAGDHAGGRRCRFLARRHGWHECW